MPVQAGKTAADSAGQDEHRNIAVRPGRLRSDYGNIRIGLHALDAIFRMALRGGSNNYDNRFAILFRPVPRYLGAEKEKHPGSCTFGRTTLWKRGWLSGMIRLYINSMNFRCRKYSLMPSGQYEIFDMPAYNICFVGFNSCYLNDHMNKVGQIYPTCVTLAKTQVKEMVKQGRILVAVWHHNASGRPMANNYLDNRILNPIIDMGIHIALHGHQHYSGVVEEYHNAFKSGKLLMFSTGSLYGATEALSYGAPRQYNILEMEKENDKLKLSIHLREDCNPVEYGIPTWVDGRIKEIGASSWETILPYPVQPFDDIELSDLINRGFETGDYTEAIEMLREKSAEDKIARKRMLDLMMKGKQYNDIISYIGDPQTDEDALFVMKAAYELNDKDINARVKAYRGIKTSQSAHIRKMVDYL